MSSPNPQSPRQWNPESRVANRFVLKEPMGHGASGAVWRARDRWTQTDCAIKTLDTPHDRVPDEVAVLSSLRHPNLANIRDYLPGERPAFTMDLVHGQDLSDLGGSCDAATLARVAADCLDAVAFLHGRGLLHRDIKPQNIRVTPEGRAVLLDLGFAILARDAASDLSGTPAWLAPEVVAGQPQSPASDLYALGASLLTAADGGAREALGSWAARLSAQDPDHRPSAAQARTALRKLMDEIGAPPVLLGPRLVGREQEMAVIQSLVGALMDDETPEPSLLVLQGTPGSGRRRLLTAARHRAQLLGVPALDLTQVRVEDAEGEGAMDVSPGELVARRATAAVRRISHITQDHDGKLMLCVDLVDDPRGHDLLHHLMAHRPDAPLLVVVRAMPDDPQVDSVLSRLGDRGRRLEADPLSDAALCTLVRDALVLEDGSDAEEVAMAIKARASALPGPFLGALHALAAMSGVSTTARGATLTVPRDQVPVPGADTARELLDDLPATTGRALRMLAALQTAAGPVTRHALGMDGDSVRLLLGRGMITQTWSDGVAWTSPTLPMETEDLDPELHLAVARAAESAASELGTRGPRIAAWHQLQAAPDPAALDHALALAEQALLAGEISEARKLLHATGRAETDLVEKRHDAAVMLARVDASLGDGDGARWSVALAEDTARGPEAKARAAALRGEVHRLLGEIAEATRALDEAVGLGLDGDDLARSLRIRAVCRLQSGATDEALDDADRAAEVAESPRERAACLGTRAQVLHRAGDTDRAMAAVEAAMEASDQAGPMGTLPAGLLQLRGLVRAAGGESAAAIIDLENATAAFRAAEHLINLANTLNNLALMYERSGRMDAAATTHEESLAIRARVGDAVGMATSQVNRGTLMIRSGHMQEAVNELDAGLQEFTRLGHPRGRVAALTGLAERALVLADTDTARAHAQEARALATASGFTAERSATELILAEAMVLDQKPEPPALDLLTHDEAAKPQRPARLHSLRARLHARADDLPAAKEEARRAVDAARQPEDVVTAMAALHACGLLGDKERPALARAVDAVHSPHTQLEGTLLLAAGFPDTVDQRSIANALERSLQHLNPEEALTMYNGRWHEQIQQTLDLLRDDGGEVSVQALEGLIGVTRMLADNGKPNDVLQEILDAAIQLAEAEHGFVVLREQDDFSCAAARSAEGKSIKVPKRLLSSTIILDVLANGRPITTGNARTDSRFGGMLSVNNLKLKSVACLPFTAAGQVRGAIYLDHPGREDLFSDTRIKVLSSFADHAALVFQRSEDEAEIRDLNLRLKQQLKHERKQRCAVSEELRAKGMSKDSDPIIAESPSMRAVLETVNRVAMTGIPVLIVGDTGTGKDLIAREIHARSERSDGPFISENCAAIPAGLLEAEVFGAKRGAYTGAINDRPGLMSLAATGSLFLDEVGDMPMELQSKLLRALEDGSIRPLGSGDRVKTDFRLITATNRDPEELRAGERFRPDLFYRIGGTVIDLPPLKDRPEDVAAFIDRYGAARGRDDRPLTPSTRRKLLAYDWPGNFRELQNEMARLHALVETGPIEEQLLSDRIRTHRAKAPEDIPYDLKSVRKWAIARALQDSDGAKDEAARRLGVSRSTLYQELKRFDLGAHVRAYKRRSAKDRC